MKRTIKENKFLIIFAIIGISFFIYSTIYEINNHDNTVKKVDCYDRYRNKIDGLECEQTPIPVEAYVFLNFILIMMLTFVGLILDLWNKFKKNF